MTAHPTHSCIRCGTPVHETNAACRDRLYTDPHLIRAWKEAS